VDPGNILLKFFLLNKPLIIQVMAKANVYHANATIAPPPPTTPLG
jgi:hypothetical protein